MAKKPQGRKPKRVKAPTRLQSAMRRSTKAGRGVVRNRKEGRATNIGRKPIIQRAEIAVKKKKTGRFRKAP
jgi:hypothetical protein